MDDDEVLDSMNERHEARIRDEAFERGVQVGRTEANQEKIEFATAELVANVDRMSCSVCLFIPAADRPERWEDNPLTIIGGFMVCDDHSGLVMNRPLMDWYRNDHLRKGTRP